MHIAPEGFTRLFSRLRTSQGGWNTRSLILIALSVSGYILVCGGLSFTLVYLISSNETFRLPVLIEKPKTPSENAPMLMQTIRVPTLGCDRMTVKLGEMSYSLKRLNQPAESSTPAFNVAMLPTTADSATWLQGTNQRKVILLGAGAVGQPEVSLPGLQQAEIIDESCNQVIYQLDASQAGSISDLGGFDLAGDGILIFAATSADGQGWIIPGEVAGETIYDPASTPAENEAELAEIGILEATASTDGNTIQVQVSIYNYGSNPLTVTNGDIQLVEEGGSAQSPAGANPALPQAIKAGETKELTVTFARPAAGWGILKVFTVEYNLADFIQ